tara:strand:+ start:1951 stop:2160 length:210 start_codon:yes stop_codon:yes gene_type:complete
MEEATAEELKESIDALQSYHNRLKEEVIAISNKLRMPKEKINESIQDNNELKKIESIIKKLSIEREKKL